jgi:hypothetical protein
MLDSDVGARDLQLVVFDLTRIGVRAQFKTDR